MATTAELATSLEAEIRRLGLHDTPANVNGLAVYLSDGEKLYPDGFVRIDGDGGTSTLVDAAATLERLQQATATGDFETDQQTFYDCMVEAE